MAGGATTLTRRKLTEQAAATEGVPPRNLKGQEENRTLSLLS